MLLSYRTKENFNKISTRNGNLMWGGVKMGAVRGVGGLRLNTYSYTVLPKTGGGGCNLTRADFGFAHLLFGVCLCLS